MGVLTSPSSGPAGGSMTPRGGSVLYASGHYTVADRAKKSRDGGGWRPIWGNRDRSSDVADELVERDRSEQHGDIRDGVGEELHGQRGGRPADQRDGEPGEDGAEHHGRDAIDVPHVGDRPEDEREGPQDERVAQDAAPGLLLGGDRGKHRHIHRGVVVLVLDGQG